MKQRYRLIRRGERGSKFYCVDSFTGKRTSLATTNHDDANQIVLAKNQALRQPALKLQLFRNVRAGRVHILFGSTQKMGTGANAQERLIALHHLDAPWRPADVEQREGRILRRGSTKNQACAQLDADAPQDLAAVVADADSLKEDYTGARW